MIQEYLGDTDAMDDYFKQKDGPTPLFAHAPDVYHYTCHTIIDPDGKINEIFTTKNSHQNGATVAIKRISNVALEKTAVKYAEAYINEGGYGPFGIQFRQDKNGIFKGQEINLRTNGNTFSRLLMGQDDLGLIVNGALPTIDFPIYEKQGSSYDVLIAKSLECGMVHFSDITKIEKTGVWSK